MDQKTGNPFGLKIDLGPVVQFNDPGGIEPVADQPVLEGFKIAVFFFHANRVLRQKYARKYQKTEKKGDVFATCHFI
jgi:hypothetical protein